MLTASLSIVNQVEIKEVSFDMDKASTKVVPVDNGAFDPKKTSLKKSVFRRV